MFFITDYETLNDHLRGQISGEMVKVIGHDGIDGLLEF